jgi:WhiB family redox-sensing transcriptional regulator
MQLTTLFDGLCTDFDDTDAALDIPCRENDADLWFAERPEDVEFAKTLCGLCPARTQCLAGALERQEPWGVWGGQLFVQGAIVARKRPRGRPRKNPVAA